MVKDRAQTLAVDKRRCVSQVNEKMFLFQTSKKDADGTTFNDALSSPIYTNSLAKARRSSICFWTEALHVPPVDDFLSTLTS